MFRYVLKRALIGIVTLFLLSSATFFLMKATPGSPISGEKYKNEAQRQMAIKKYNLDKPVYEQYTIYMNDIIHGDLGESIVRTGRDVNMTISQSFPVTAKLGSVAFASALVCGIALGTVAALSKRKWVSNVCMFIATIGVSVPSFLIGVLLMIILGVKLKLFPFVGLNTPANYVLPAMSLAFYPIAMICRLTRSSLLEVMRQDYIILARSKGTPYKKVVFKHALKNALIPVITYTGPAFAYMLTGSFVIETLFSVPGIGREMVSSIQNRDYPMIMGLTIFLGFLVITFNIITDVLSAFVDPRIKLK